MPLNNNNQRHVYMHDKENRKLNEKWNVDKIYTTEEERKA